ncbi:hypothetical protein RGU70_02150 [Herbaspirillum sp. RTI4]|uniref:hypothetical protein n=1 Tax=Herbaspirillum sp. RTI4 TaxID=3048640 RepID=UPI002AB47255|nr:hypothetical protein [Herbaspirillum sp. RTI4]MDY7577128.1 hypothetical protein [Herbaspirillum sp. RTI4]MEA9982870.1 hypothetical protein [Herbaspirillum sp. RTI4]
MHKFRKAFGLDAASQAQKKRDNEEFEMKVYSLVFLGDRPAKKSEARPLLYQSTFISRAKIKATATAPRSEADSFASRFTAQLAEEFPERLHRRCAAMAPLTGADLANKHALLAQMKGDGAWRNLILTFIDVQKIDAHQLSLPGNPAVRALAAANAFTRMKDIGNTPIEGIPFANWGDAKNITGLLTLLEHCPEEIRNNVAQKLNAQVEKCRALHTDILRHLPAA